MKVKVLFFGVLSEVSGTGIREYIDVKSMEELKKRIDDDFPEIINYQFKVSLNNALINNDATLTDGDEVALLPPFAGG
jgi:molybdopterin synthase sulfur carrier subunit